MRYELPQSVRKNLAKPEVRLHHLLWHAIRNSWHEFTESERNKIRDNYPSWEPKIPRFIAVPSPPNGNGVEINWTAGESFLYMHRKMISLVNKQLSAIGEPELVPWDDIPELDDPDYPVPDRVPDGDENEPKSDSHLALMKKRSAQVHTSLRQVSLASLGAFIESAIHDFMHMRWAEKPGIMNTFPLFNHTNLNIKIPSQFHEESVDYLGHPYSSHVNSTFWKLHGWIDKIIDHWRVENGLETIEWKDTWVGDMPADDEPVSTEDSDSNPSVITKFMSHGQHSETQLIEVFRMINEFENCHASFDYVRHKGIPIPALSDISKS